MKQTINVVKIHKHASDNPQILKAVGNANEGKCEFSARDLEGYLKLQSAFWPNLPMILVADADQPNTYHISDDAGKTFTLSLEWAELYETKEEHGMIVLSTKVIDPELINSPI